MPTTNKNKVRFGLKNVHYAKITGWSDAGGVSSPIYDDPVAMQGAVSLSMSASGENENFYADDIAYYLLGNNSGYEGELELALINTEFQKDILGTALDDNGVLVEKNSDEPAQFALMFEFTGDKKQIRHVFYCCSASRPSSEGSTMADTKEVQTETVTLTASPLPNGLTKAKTCEDTDEPIYQAWYESVYTPKQLNSTPSASTTSTSTTSGTTE